MSLSSFDPDTEFDTAAKRPAWSQPKTPLSEKALAACGRKYFLGQRKSNSDFALWNPIEERALGADDESWLYRKYVEFWIEWAKGKNGRGIVISFLQLIRIIQNKEREVQWLSENRKKVLEDRKNTLPEIDLTKLE